MNHDELIKSMKDKGITVKVDNGNKLEFSNGETYVKDSHSGEYKKTKNYMENKIDIRKLVESKLFESSNTYDSSSEKWNDITKGGQWIFGDSIVRILDKSDDSVTIKYEGSGKTRELSKERALKSLKR